MHILVVEDERALCETVVRSLRRLAYSVDFCFDGNRAAELLGITREGLRKKLLRLDKTAHGHDGEEA